MPDVSLNLLSLSVQSAAQATLPLQSSPELSTAHFATGVVIVVGIFLAAIYYAAANDGKGLTDDQQVIRDQVRAALDEPGRTERFSAQAIRRGELPHSEVQSRLTAILRGERSGDPETVREATRDIGEAIAGVWRDRTQSIPKLVLSLGEWALLVLVFGSVAMFSGAIVAGVSSLGGDHSAREFLGLAAAAGRDLLVGIQSLLSTVPYGAELADIGFVIAIVAGTGLVTRPYLVATTLITIAIGLFALERRVGDTVGEPNFPRREVFAYLLGGALSIVVIAAWIGLVVETVATAVGYAAYGELVAFLLVAGPLAIGAGYLAALGATQVRDRFADADGPAFEVATLFGLRAVAHVLRPLAILAAVGYFAWAVAGGGFAELVGAGATASLQAQAAVIAIVLTVIGAVLWELRDAYPGVRRALVELGARERKKTTAFLSSMPYFGVATVFITAWAMGFPIYLAAALAILAGFGTLTMTRIYRRTRRYHAERDRGAAPMGSLLAIGQHVETAAEGPRDDGTRYLLTIGDTLYAHEDAVALADTGAEVLAQRAAGRDPGPTVEEWYADSLRRFGLADYHETAGWFDQDGHRTGGKLRERTRKQVLEELRPPQPTTLGAALLDAAGRLDVEKPRAHINTLVDDVCEDIPEEIARERILDMVASGGLRMDTRGVVWLKNDIWAADSDAVQAISNEDIDGVF